MQQALTQFRVTGLRNRQAFTLHCKNTCKTVFASKGQSGRQLCYRLIDDMKAFDRNHYRRKVIPTSGEEWIASIVDEH